MFASFLSTGSHNELILEETKRLLKLMSQKEMH